MIVAVVVAVLFAVPLVLIGLDLFLGADGITPAALGAAYGRKYPHVVARRDHRRAVRRAGRAWRAQQRGLGSYDPNIEAARVGSAG